MKKIISLIMVVVMMCLALASCTVTPPTTEPTGTTEPTVDGTTAPSATVPGGPADAGFGLDGETPTDVSVFKYKELKDGTVSITGTYAQAAELKKIVVPAVIDGKKVSTLGESALATLYATEEIVVSGYVVKVEPYAFRDCTSLKTVKLSENIVTIDEGAFQGCSALTNTDFLPATVTTIGARAFESCSGLTKATIPDSVKSIGGYTFVNCKKLVEVKLPAGLTAIPERMFQYCIELINTTGDEGIVIPSTVTTIGNFAFHECKKTPSITIPEGVTKIGKNAFDTCQRISEITIPNSVTSIGDRALNSCTRLNTVKLPIAAEVKVGEALFENSKKINSITLKAGSNLETYCNEWLTKVADMRGYTEFTITAQ